MTWIAIAALICLAASKNEIADSLTGCAQAAWVIGCYAAVPMIWVLVIVQLKGAS